MLVYEVCSLSILTQRIMPQDEERCQGASGRRVVILG